MNHYYRWAPELQWNHYYRWAPELRSNHCFRKRHSSQWHWEDFRTLYRCGWCQGDWDRQELC
jgi:hypothetical protein